MIVIKLPLKNYKVLNRNLYLIHPLAGSLDETGIKVSDLAEFSDDV
jgi:hypothetical protein